MYSFYLETVVFLPLSVVNCCPTYGFQNLRWCEAQPIVKIAAIERRYHVKTKVNPNIFCHSLNFA